jgi:hypothetical protein
MVTFAHLAMDVELVLEEPPMIVYLVIHLKFYINPLVFLAVLLIIMMVVANVKSVIRLVEIVMAHPLMIVRHVLLAYYNMEPLVLVHVLLAPFLSMDLVKLVNLHVPPV